MYKPQWDLPLYPAAEVGRLVGLNSARIRRWLEGYKYKYKEAVHRQSPVIHRRETVDTSYASFYELIDLLFVKSFINHGFSLQKVRSAFNEASDILETDHFSRQCFFTSGNNIYLKVKESGNAILELLSGGQWVIAPIIEQLATQIDFDDSTELARRWFPPGFNRLIVLDPLVSFGSPSIFGKGITTLNAYDFYIAENENINRLCKWMDIKQKEAQAAVDFEKNLAA